MWMMLSSSLTVIIITRQIGWAKDIYHYYVICADGFMVACER
ncbi:Uncharacterised protein [Escherichia coli]|nr:Uncharacterised protein [Escherichia coli]SVF39376.1 Uncharacterised protein [Escherichia coli]